MKEGPIQGMLLGMLLEQREHALARTFTDRPGAAAQASRAKRADGTSGQHAGGRAFDALQCGHEWRFLIGFMRGHETW